MGRAFELTGFDRTKEAVFPIWPRSWCGSKVDLIVTWFTPAAEAAKQATREIPIVMALAGDPVGTGLIKSLNRPGGNITGMAGVTAELAGKSVEIIRELLPKAQRVVALANVPDPFSKPFLEYIDCCPGIPRSRR